MGAIDEFCVYGRTLNAAEIAHIMAYPYFHPNSAPLAVAGDDIAVACTGPLTEVTLDGTASSDPEGDGLDHLWTSATGSIDAPTAATTLAAFPVGVSEARLEVSDAEFAANDTVRIHVLDGAPPVLGSYWPFAPGLYVGETGIAGGDAIVLVGPTTFRAAAEDQCGSVAAVRFSADDGTMVEDTEAPFAFTYAPQGVGLQYRTVRIVALDDQGNASPAVEVPVTVLAVAPQT